MAGSTRLTATLAFKAAGSIPKVLYIGYDTDEAKKALEAAKDKGYFVLKVLKSFDQFPIDIWRADPVESLK
jgi:hypothetical protein